MPTVRLAKGSELERCREIEAASGAVFRDSPYPHVADAEPNDIEILRRAYVEKLLWVAVDEHDRPIGQLTAAEGPQGLLIAQIDVVPEAQGRGLGRAMISEAEQAARQKGLPFVWLRTFRDIPWNAPFYEKLGFREVEGGVFGESEEAVAAHEIESGLDPSARVTMRKELA